MTNLELNRATLARQLLLQRHAMPAREALSGLLALQAQDALPPFLALFSRLLDFDRDELAQLIAERVVVRGTLMRATLHMILAAQFAAVRLAVARGIARAMPKRLTAEVEAFGLETVLAAARAQFSGGPVRLRAVRDHLAALFPDVDERALVHAVRSHLALVHIPGGAEWSFAAGPPVLPSDSWIGGSSSGQASEADYSQAVDELVVAYLRAFGPASVADAQEWTGLGGLTAVFERLRPQLLAMSAADDGRELFDLEDAPRPAATTPAPPRLLPAYDNLVLGHADRRRVIAAADRPRLVTRNLRVQPTFLIDGFVAGLWSMGQLGGQRGKASMTLERFRPAEALADGTADALQREGEGLLRFVYPKATVYAVRLA